MLSQTLVGAYSLLIKLQCNNLVIAQQSLSASKVNIISQWSHTLRPGSLLTWYNVITAAIYWKMAFSLPIDKKVKPTETYTHCLMQWPSIIVGCWFEERHDCFSEISAQFWLQVLDQILKYEKHRNVKFHVDMNMIHWPCGRNVKMLIFVLFSQCLWLMWVSAPCPVPSWDGHNKQGFQWPISNPGSIKLVNIELVCLTSNYIYTQHSLANLRPMQLCLSVSFQWVS